MGHSRYLSVCFSVSATPPSLTPHPEVPGEALRMRFLLGCSLVVSRFPTVSLDCGFLDQPLSPYSPFGFPASSILLLSFHFPFSPLSGFVFKRNPFIAVFIGVEGGSEGR